MLAARSIVHRLRSPVTVMHPVLRILEVQHWYRTSRERVVLTTLVVEHGRVTHDVRCLLGVEVQHPRYR
jgi:hypothetical protein